MVRAKPRASVSGAVLAIVVAPAVAAAAVAVADAAAAADPGLSVEPDILWRFDAGG